MLRPRRLVAVVVAAAFAAGALGCGDSDEPTIPNDAARILLSDLQEIQANVDDGSCIVAGDRTDSFIDNVQALPSGVDEDVRRALENGADQLQILLADPDQCDGETVTEPTTTEDTTTEETETEPTETLPTETEPTTPTTPTSPTTPGNPGGGGSGGVGPGSPGGL